MKCCDASPQTNKQAARPHKSGGGGEGGVIVGMVAVGDPMLGEKAIFKPSEKTCHLNKYPLRRNLYVKVKVFRRLLILSKT